MDHETDLERAAEYRRTRDALSTLLLAWAPTRARRDPCARGDAGRAARVKLTSRGRDNDARRQLPPSRTSRSLRAKASGWPAYPDSPPTKPPWWLGNTVGCCPRSSAAAADVRAVTVPADSSPTAITTRVGAARSASTSGR